MRFSAFAFLCVTCGAVVANAQTPSVRRAEDQAAFTKARAVDDPEQRVAALKQFVEEYPRTPLAGRAAALELETLLQAFPDRTAEIHRLASTDVASTAMGFERWSEEARLADLLASAGTGGADLADARPWAQNAVAAMTEEGYRRQMADMRAKYKLDRLTAKQLHGDFLRTRASFLAALANVDLREKDTDGAEHALAEAYRLDPLSSEISSLRGQLALAQHQDTEALDDFERAEATGDLKKPWRAEMLRLYQGSGKGDAAGLNDAIDALYGKLFPPLFTLPPRKLPAGGHTVLLELFTGSGCEPCVAPDLAVESLLTTYSRQDLVVLEYDEHIPRPDPLANPDSVARAVTYRVGSTPQAFVDGEELPVVGASRRDVENVVVGFAEAIEDHAAEATGVQLTLTASRGADAEIIANVKVSASALAAQAKDSQGPAAEGMPAHPVLHLALVEDQIRYSGENGVRFHRMVVRKLARAGMPNLAAANPNPIQVSFRPAEIDRDQTRYLNAFEASNDRFGEVHFLTKDIPLQPNHLGVVAWVEDAVTHQVFDAVYAAVPGH